MAGEHTINFVEGEGISIQADFDPARDAWDVEIANTAGPPGSGVPAGGSTGQVLEKNTGADYDTHWATGGGSPTGAAGGVLNGTYPNPGFAADMATQTELDAVAAAKISLGLLDAKGDLIAASANDTAARLPVGTNGQILSADSTASTGLKWVAAPTGGGSPATDTQVWMPLIDSDGSFVLDSDEGQIPTLFAIV